MILQYIVQQIPPRGVINVMRKLLEHRGNHKTPPSPTSFFLFRYPIALKFYIASFTEVAWFGDKELTFCPLLLSFSALTSGHLGLIFFRISVSSAVLLLRR